MARRFWAAGGTLATGGPTASAFTGRRRRPVAALVSLEHVDAEALALSAHLAFLALIARARREVAAGRRLSLEQMKRAVLSRRPATGRKPKAPRSRGR